MTNFVQKYANTDLNAPPFTGQNGVHQCVLRAVLVNGYGGVSVTITSITRSGTTATATCSAADILRLQTGSIVTVSGCTGGDASLYNITVAVASIASTTTFTYTMAGTPTGSATGSPVFTLSLPITSASETGTTITAVLANANTTLVTGNWITVSGFTPSGANGTVQITVTDSTHITWQAAGSLGSITGSGTYYKAGLGWTEPFAATSSVAMFKPQSISGLPQHILRLEEAGLSTGAAKETVATACESASDLNTLTNQYPTSAQIAVSGTAAKAGVCWRKSTTADQTVRPWVLYGDGGTFYLVINSDASATLGRRIQAFGGFLTFKSGDAYNSFISGDSVFNSTGGAIAQCGMAATYQPQSSMSTAGLYAARTYSQSGGSILLQNVTNWWDAGSGSSNTLGGTNRCIGNPNGPDGAVWMQPCFAFEGRSTARGRYRGIFDHCQSSAPTADGDTITNVAGLSGVTLTTAAISSSSAGFAYFDTFGPW